MDKTPLVLTLCLLAAAVTCFAQTPEPLLPPVSASDPGMFPFVVPWNDSSPGTATDVSFLNDGPAGSHGFIVVKDGHFVESQTGRRIRFLGVSFWYHQDFPIHADADAVAARLAKLGINVVRIFCVDLNTSDLWDTSVPGHHTIAAAGRDRLDYLIAALKRNGIYVDIVLHAGRIFTPDDGFPPSVNGFWFDKRVDNYDRRMIDLQKQFAHDYLTHVNPYTGLSLAADPCVVDIEINNEDSLVGTPWWNPVSELNTLREPFRGELVELWNAWLAKKYPSTNAITAAWTKSITPPGPGLLDSVSQWTLENTGLPATMTTTPGVSTSTPPEADIAVPRVDGTVFHVSAHIEGLTLQEGATYTISFAAKADAPRDMPVNAGLDEPDWHGLGLNATARLTTDWKPFRYFFTVKGSVPGHDRLSFVLGGSTGAVSIKDLQISPGVTEILPAGQTLEARNIDMPSSFIQAVRADWVRFLIDTERGYVDEMRGYLVKDLGVHANIVDTQIEYGGIESLYRESQSAYTDAHTYWQHPVFPHKAFDRVDWYILNTPLVDDLAGSDHGTFLSLAEYRVAGKPYSVSEYNHPAPSDYQAETLPEYATYAAQQDWDMIYIYNYGDYGTSYDNTRMQQRDWFAINENPAKVTFLPSAALIFRGGDFAPAAGTTTLNISGTTIFAGVQAESAWRKANGGSDPATFGSRLQVAPVWKATADEIITMPGAPGTSWIKAAATPAGAQYLACGAGAQAIAGYVGGETVIDGPLTMTFPRFGDNFASLTLAALDNKPTAQSGHLLLTICGKAENVGMVFNAKRESLGLRWGDGPALAEGIPAQVTLSTASKHVWALDTTGHRRAEIPSQSANGALTFTIGPADQTVWYEIAQ